MKTKLVLSIRSLDIGGAERQFIELVKHIDKAKFDVTVCTMYGGVQEELVKKIEGVHYVNLQKKGRYDLFAFFKRYKGLLQKTQPDLIYSFLGEMNLSSLWCKPKKSKIIWGFRASNMDLKQYGKLSQLLFWLQKRLSCGVDKIIANSHASITFHAQQGFCMEKAVVIPNGIDTKRYQRDSYKRALFRKKYDLGNEDIAVGIIARIDYMKGYTFFARAANRIFRTTDNVKFFAIGDGDKGIKEECDAILGDESGQRFFWLGKQSDVENFYSGFDIGVSASLGEGFSNSIAEAMSCECACVVTDVGDSAMIVGDCGIVVPPNDPEKLADAIEEMMQRDILAIGKCARKRIEENFSIRTMVKNTEKALEECVVS
jgi:glycosyltransferase involved in cell wall biosynthesis